MQRRTMFFGGVQAATTISPPNCSSSFEINGRSRLGCRRRLDSGAYSSSTDYSNSPGSDTCCRETEVGDQAEVSAAEVDLISALAGKWIVSDDLLSPLRRSDDSGVNDTSMADGGQCLQGVAAVLGAQAQVTYVLDGSSTQRSFSTPTILKRGDASGPIMKLENPEGALELSFDGSAVASLRRKGLIAIGSPETAPLVGRRRYSCRQRQMPATSDFSINGGPADDIENGDGDGARSYKNFLIEHDENLSPVSPTCTSPGPNMQPTTGGLHHMVETKLLTPVKFFGAQTPSKTLPFSPTQALASTDEFFNGTLTALTSTPLPSNVSQFGCDNGESATGCDNYAIRRSRDLQPLDTPKEYGCEDKDDLSPLNQWKAVGATATKGHVPKTPTPFKNAYAAAERKGGRIDHSELLRSPPTLDDVREIISKDLFMASSSWCVSSSSSTSASTRNSNKRRRYYRPTKAKSHASILKYPEKSGTDWYKIACGQTSVQLELTKRAKEFLGVL